MDSMWGVFSAFAFIFSSLSEQEITASVAELLLKARDLDPDAKYRSRALDELAFFPDIRVAQLQNAPANDKDFERPKTIIESAKEFRLASWERLLARNWFKLLTRLIVDDQATSTYSSSSISNSVFLEEDCHSNQDVCSASPMTVLTKLKQRLESRVVKIR